MNFAVSKAIIHYKSKYRYAVTALIIWLLFWSMFVMSNFIGIVVLLILMGCYVFYSEILVTKPTDLILDIDQLSRDNQNYTWDQFSKWFIEIDESKNLYNVYILKSSEKEIIGFTLLEDSSKINIFIETMNSYIVYEEFRLPAIDLFMKIIRL